MATSGSTPNWRVARRALNAGQLWANLSIPPAGGKLQLHSNGTPDALTNPNAIHLGATKAGAKLISKPKFDNYMVDEFRGPIDTQIGEIEMVIAAELVAVTDAKLGELLTPGFGTFVDDSGTGTPTYEQLTFGAKAISYTSIAHIFPCSDDATKFFVWQIYKAINDAGLDFGASRKELGFTPVNFRGYEITTRAVGDTLGNAYRVL